MKTQAQIANLFGCSEARVREQFRRNSAHLTAMAEQAERTGRKINGFTAIELREKAAAMANRATA